MILEGGKGEESGEERSWEGMGVREGVVRGEGRRGECM